MTKTETFADFYDKFGHGEGWPDDCYRPKDDPGNCHGRICLHRTRQNDGYDLIVDTFRKLDTGDWEFDLVWENPKYETPLSYALLNPEFKQYYEKRKEEEKNRVKFSDFIQEEDLLKQIKKATV